MREELLSFYKIHNSSRVWGIKVKNKYGDINKFAIEYQLKKNHYRESGTLKESWGVFRLWINGMNICKYKHENSEKDYEWNLIYLIEWLCENLEYILGYDPFPLPVSGNTTLELIRKSGEFEPKEEDEMYLWYQSRSRWIHRHNWFCNRDGSYLSNVYFRRKDDGFEVSWDNGFWTEQGIEFISVEGTGEVGGELFKSVLLGFLEEILIQLESSVETNFCSDLEQISALYKKVKLIKL